MTKRQGTNPGRTFGRLGNGSRHSRVELESLESRDLLSTTMSGLLGSYYGNTKLTGPAVARIDPTINFNWGWEQAPPGIPGMPKDSYSVKWTGFVTVPTTGTYTFYVTSDDGDRLFVNGSSIISDWTLHSVQTDTSQTLTLTAGHAYAIELDYLEGLGAASVKLEWSGPGVSRQVAGNLSPIALATVNDWFSQNIQDAGLQQVARADYTRDGQITRNDMLGIYSEAEAEDGPTGHVTAAQIHDFQLLADNLVTPAYVHYLADKVVHGDPANALFQGQSLGNLSTQSTTLQLEELVGKWFLGTDHPAIGAGMSYVKASGTLFGSGPTYTDVVQGDTGDCYFLSTLAQVAYRNPSAIVNMFINNGDGTYTVRFVDPSGDAAYETVDLYLPEFSSWGILAYANQGNSPSNTNQKLWVALAEKAYAELSASGWSQLYQSGVSANSYASLNGGWGGFALAQLTGQSSTDNWVQGANPATVVAEFNAGKLIFLGSNNTTSGGIIGDHEYSLVGYNSSTGVFTLYNPWGYIQQVTWSTIQANFGDWSYSN